MKPAMEHAVEIAMDALAKRARILDGQDPEIATACRDLAVQIETLVPPKWEAKADRETVSGIDQDDVRWRLAARVDRARRKGKRS